MTIHRHIFRKLLLSSILAGATLGAANAQDASAVAERFKKLLSSQNIEMSWTGISGASPSFALEGVKFAPVGAEKPLELGKLAFEGVSEDKGAIVIDTLKTDPYSLTEDGATIDIGAVALTGVKIPAENAPAGAASMLFYNSAELPVLSVTVAGRKAFSLEGLTMEVTEPVDGKPMEFSGAAEKFTADLTLVEDAQSKAVIEALGYQTITGFFETSGTWNPTDGRMGLAQFDISVENAGTFGTTFDIGGYTPAFIASLQEMQKQMAAQPEGADNSAQGMAMLGLMQQLTFHSTGLRWDDDSLTGKVLEYVAKQQNMKVDDIKNQAKAIVPFLTGQLNNPELSAQITAAVSTYLDDPQSIEVVAEPAAPVPFAQIMAAGMSNPLDLTKTLGVTVTANQDAEE
jgi:hypothetical protein